MPVANKLANKLHIIVAATVVSVAGVAPNSLADCCAGGRAEFLAYGGRANYSSVGGRLRPGPVAPFHGMSNPRYASNRTSGGPVTGGRPSHHIATRQFVNFGQLQSIANRQHQHRQLAQIASDSKVIAGDETDRLDSADEPSQQERAGQFSPDYPGQTYLDRYHSSVRPQVSTTAVVQPVQPAQRPTAAAASQFASGATRLRRSRMSSSAAQRRPQAVTPQTPVTTQIPLTRNPLIHSPLTQKSTLDFGFSG